MTKKIIVGILSLGIVVVGIMAMNRLRYIERSTWVFKVNNEQSFRGRSDRQHSELEQRTSHSRTDEFRRNERSSFENLPDSVRQRILAEREIRSAPDSLQEEKTKSYSGNRDSFRRDGYDGRGHGRRGNSVQLITVGWFLAVFALFTIVTIYIDKLFKYIHQRRLSDKIE